MNIRPIKYRARESGVSMSKYTTSLAGYISTFAKHISTIATIAFLGSSVYAAPPSAAVLKSPLNELSSIGASQDFTWTVVPEATHYRLWVADSSNTILFKKWFKATSTELNCDGTNCTTTVAVDFSTSDFSIWQVRTLNADGLGSWSERGKFWSMQNRPLAATLVAPLDFVFGASPTFEWEPVFNATWYKLRLRVPGADPEIIYDQWTRASASCLSLFSCSKVVNPVPGNPQAYEWSVRTYSPAGLGPWSEFASVVLNDEPEPAVSGSYRVTPSGLADFTSNCCSFSADDSYAIEIENAGGGSVDIVTLILFDSVGQFAMENLDSDDECVEGASLNTGEKCLIGISVANGDITGFDLEFSPPDEILIFWGVGEIFVIPLELAQAQ